MALAWWILSRLFRHFVKPESINIIKDRSRCRVGDKRDMVTTARWAIVLRKYDNASHRLAWFVAVPSVTALLR